MSIPQDPISVTALTEQIKFSLKELFPNVWVQGEVSDLVNASSGHLYFNLKDSKSKISAVMWKSSAARMRFRLKEGMDVLCHGAIDVYGPRGSYQLTVGRMEPLGVGELQLAFEQLRKKLTAEGLFEHTKKRPLPFLPRRIAVITSPDGAAIRDFLEVVGRRFRNVSITLVPTPVQGPGASHEIVAAIKRANLVEPQFDLLVVCRGGGSAEDLWSFNEESVVRAIAGSRIPVITGIGHEIDVTLADLAADVRALTPSEAAERILPKQADLISALREHRTRMVRALTNSYTHARRELQIVAERPCLRLPLEFVQLARQRLDELETTLDRFMQTSIQNRKHLLQKSAVSLNALSPLAILARGYSVTTTSEGEVVRNAVELAIDDRLETRLAHGSFESRVTAIHTMSGQK